MGFIQSFIFNRTVLGLMITACFVVTALDLYFDSSQAKVVKLSALTIAKNNIDIITQLQEMHKTQGAKGSGAEQAEAFNKRLKEIGSPMSIQIFSSISAKDQFQKEAIESLHKSPEPFSSMEINEEQSLLRYAVNNTAFADENVKSYLELDIPMDNLEDLATQEAIKTLWVLVVLAILSSVSLAIFVGFLRHSAAVLVETQKAALNEQKQLTYAYGRFFPHQFLDLLNKKSVLDIHLGDQTEKQMAVLFADIRNFTSIIEKKTPAESFQIINDYLRDVGPIIRKHHGFIDKYIGDAIMALFEKSDDALLATLEIMDLLKRIGFRGDASKQITEIGAGIHFGTLMVGTVGEIERMDGTVISDIANSASRLESLNKSYGTHVIISEQFLNSLTYKERFKIRLIDHIYAKGKSNGIKIYEVFDADSLDLVQKKEQIQKDYEKALECYRNRQFKEALDLFQACQKILPQDLVIAIFIKRCEKYIAEGTPENWEPIAKLFSKDDVT
jgi:class 3 adenylate cyclase